MEPTDVTPPPATSRRRRPTARGVQAAAVRASYATYSRVNPLAAGRAAARLWCQVPAEAGRRKDNRRTHGTVEHVPMAHGGSYAVEVWGEGPLVYLLHGWGSWRGQLGALVDPLVSRGYRVVAPDAASHGYSDAGAFGIKYSTGSEIAASFAAVAENYGPADAVIAHSMGSVAATRLAADDGAVGKLVLIAPSPDLDVPLNEFARALGLSPRAAREFRAEIERMAGATLDEFDLPRFGAGLALPPTLVLHDDTDKQSPVATGRAIAASWPRVTYHETHGLGHQRILLDEGVITAAVDFVAAPASSSTSAADSTATAKQGQPVTR